MDDITSAKRPIVEDLEAANIAYRDAERALNEGPRAERRAVVVAARDGHGMTWQAIGDVLGISHQAARDLYLAGTGQPRKVRDRETGDLVEVVKQVRRAKTKGRAVPKPDVKDNDLVRGVEVSEQIDLLQLDFEMLGQEATA